MIDHGALGKSSEVPPSLRGRASQGRPLSPASLPPEPSSLQHTPCWAPGCSRPPSACWPLCWSAHHSRCVLVSSVFTSVFGGPDLPFSPLPTTPSWRGGSCDNQAGSEVCKAHHIHLVSSGECPQGIWLMVISLGGGGSLRPVVGLRSARKRRSGFILL